MWFILIENMPKFPILKLLLFSIVHTVGLKDEQNKIKLQHFSLAMIIKLVYQLTRFTSCCSNILNYWTKVQVRQKMLIKI